MPSFNLIGPLLGRVRTWPVDSQSGARRNALVASTALAARRAEHEDVEAFLAARGRHDTVVQVAVSGRR